MNKSQYYTQEDDIQIKKNSHTMAPAVDKI